MLALEKGGDARARIVNRLLAMRERFIGAMLIGNNIVNIGVSSFTTSVLVAVFGTEGVIYATVVMSILVIIFAEVLPKTIAITNPDKVSLLFARPVSFIVALFGPLTLAIEKLVRVMLRPFGINIDREPGDPLGDRGDPRPGRPAAQGGRRRHAPSATCSAASSTCATSPSPT